MKKIFLSLYISQFMVILCFCQSPKVAFHLSNPVGMFQKIGAKIEVRTSPKMGFLFCATQYYGSFPAYPGTQLGLEWRRYGNLKPEKKGQNFFYAKLIAGHQNQRDASGDGFFFRAEVPAGKYYGAGGGVGRHIRYGVFFLDLNAGLKYVASEVTQKSVFYITGPASILDLHLNLGLDF